ncbi:hypothetical protein ELI00_32415 (plasmid) [Rhizobium ruizarguesonis]|uniref:hypothetical protein n=1 Tax=Rhizobium ruizarguesonis TaxID=2081791 RepID=UPI00102FF49F|nr:hypothetical protein [Rhizobium ruizarguesonis]TAX65848.1 hypothetical protein ELI00_32415 [Rhizobium ruizarguesonis]
MNPREEVWQNEIDRRLASGDGMEFSVAQFAGAVDAGTDPATVANFLDQTVKSGAARKFKVSRCPVKGCTRVLGTSDITFSTCPYCLTDFQQEGLEVTQEDFYKLNGEISRDIRWMIVVHGMNSRAKWQEEFSWQIANRLRYSAPVLIYKYGWVTIDVLMRWLHRRHAKQLGDRIKIAIDQANTSGRPREPDIIAHSFGTLLLSLILEDDRFDDLRFGRVILAGSIVRPDFNWGKHVTSKRIGAILNHVGGEDVPVRYAQYAIPGSGPGGKVGYADNAVLNIRSVGFGHSDFFEPSTLRGLIADGGLWHSFLTHPLSQFRPVEGFSPVGRWKPASRVLRWPSRLVGYVIFWIVAPESWLRRRFDP